MPINEYWLVPDDKVGSGSGPTPRETRGTRNRMPSFRVQHVEH